MFVSPFMEILDPLDTFEQAKAKALHLMRVVPTRDWSDEDLRYAVFAHSIGYRVTIFQVKADRTVLRQMRTRKWHPCAALQMYERYMRRRYGRYSIELRAA